MTLHNLKLHYFLTGIAFVFVSLLLTASTGRFYSGDKLSSSLITCISQDHYGFIWVGTEYGLNKFDGYRYVSYMHHNNDTSSITDNTITTFLSDSRGRLWIGTAKGLARYDYHADKFIRYRMPGGAAPRIYSLIESHDGSILVGTAGRGLWSLDRDGENLKYVKELSKGGYSPFVSHMYEDRHGSLWLSSHLPAFYCYSKSSVGATVRRSFESPCGAPVSFLPMHDGRLLIACMYGFIEYDYRKNSIVPSSFSLGKYSNAVTINKALFDRHGNLLVCTSEAGLLTVKKGSGITVGSDAGNDQHFSLSSAWISDGFQDKNGNLWLGCYKKGLYMAGNQSDAFQAWRLSAQNVSAGGSITSFAQNADGAVYCAVQNSGIFMFDRDGRFAGHPQSPAGTSIIYRDRKGRYWIGTGHALYSYNPLSGAYSQEFTFSSAGIFCIADNGAGQLFVSVYSKGLYVYDVAERQIKKYDMNMRSPHGYLCNDWVRALLTDSRGMLWIGTSSGISCMNPANGHFDVMGWNCLMHGKQINSLCEYSGRNIVIGTDQGLFLYDRKRNQANLFPGSELLSEKQIMAVTHDRAGDLWISTTSGLWQYDHSHRKFIAHIRGNGLFTHEYSMGAVLHGADDMVAFGAGDGITVFYPDRVRAGRQKLGKVYLTNITAEGEHLDFLQKKIDVPYSKNSFQLEFSMLDFKNPDDITFQYRINGGAWLSTEEGYNRIVFNKQPSGDYHIQVRGAAGGVVSPYVTMVHVRVLPPWYFSPLAWIVYFLIVCMVVFYSFRTYSRRKKMEMDEQKMRFLIDTTHDIKTPLTLILGPVRKLKETITDGEGKKYLMTIENNAQRLLLLVNQILDQRRIDKEQFKLHFAETDMKGFVENILNMYKFTSEERHIALGVDAPDGKMPVWIDRDNFGKVLHNLLSNAFKYTFDGGHIEIVMSLEKEWCYVKVVDDGIGLREHNPGKLFERFYQGSNASDFHISGTGIGLNLCRAIVEMHGGTITARNRRDGQRGACIEVRLRRGNSHLPQEELVHELPQENAKKRQASKNCRILVVDDDKEIGKYISGELSSWYRFTFAYDGREGLARLLAEKDSVDLVISDVKMPVMDGIQMLKEIKSNSNISDIPVILLTSKAEIADRLDGLRHGADAFLAKPFDIEELHILIDNLIGNVRRLRGKFTGALEQKDKIEEIKLKGNDETLMSKVMSCINENLGNSDFNVDMLTKELGISRAQLHRKMKEITGVSTAEFIRNHRLEQAAKLLAKGDLAVTQVAYAVGFNSAGHFSVTFKKYYGVSPTEYYETNKKAKNTSE